MNTMVGNVVKTESKTLPSGMVSVTSSNAIKVPILNYYQCQTYLTNSHVTCMLQYHVNIQ